MENLGRQRGEAGLGHRRCQPCGSPCGEALQAGAGLFSRSGAADGTVRCACAERSPPGAPPAPSPRPGSARPRLGCSHTERHLSQRWTHARHRGHHFQRLLMGWVQTILHSECPEEAVSGMGSSSAGLSMASRGWPPMERDRFSIAELDVNWKKIKSRRKCKKKNQTKTIGS